MPPPPAANAPPAVIAHNIASTIKALAMVATNCTISCLNESANALPTFSPDAKAPKAASMVGVNISNALVALSVLIAKSP
jgi:hypothetical protein